MSKIYEALLRAEQERVAATPRTPAAAEEVSPSRMAYASAIAATAEPVVDSLAEPLAVDADALPPPLDQEAWATEEEPEPELELSGVRKVVWHPVLERLPALAERGKAVEQFRSLRTRLFGFRDLNTLKSILVSSGLPREGKSFIAANLAISFARHKGGRVLLIDGDMRRSSLDTLLGCGKTPGLSTYLAGQASIIEIMQQPQMNDDGTKLFAGLGSLTFIGGGDEGDKAADLSGSKRFKELIDRVSPYFDWIVVDSSPVNLVTDGVNLAAACDGVLLVTRAAVTRFETAQRALGELKAAKILGVVLNAVESTTEAIGYGGYDGYEGYDSYDPHDTIKEPAGSTAQ
jgi:capsular exopolysaccharide synthesis family protein